VKNGVELLIAELVAPVETRQILRHDIAAVSDEILEITRPKIIDDRQGGVWEFFL
jgi:hypothetical protein